MEVQVFDDVRLRQADFESPPAKVTRNARPLELQLLYKKLYTSEHKRGSPGAFPRRLPQTTLMPNLSMTAKSGMLASTGPRKEDKQSFSDSAHHTQASKLKQDSTTGSLLENSLRINSSTKRYYQSNPYAGGPHYRSVEKSLQGESPPP